MRKHLNKRCVYCSQFRITPQSSLSQRRASYLRAFLSLLSLSLESYGNRGGSRRADQKAAPTRSGRIRSPRADGRGGTGPGHRRDRELHGGPLAQGPERGPQRAQVRSVPQVRPLARPEARGDDRRATRLGPRVPAPQAPGQTGPYRLGDCCRGRNVEAPSVPPHRHHREYLRVLPRRARLRLRVQYSVVHWLRAH